MQSHLKRKLYLTFGITLALCVLCYTYVDKPVAAFFQPMQQQVWVVAFAKFSAIFEPSHMTALGFVILIVGIIVRQRPAWVGFGGSTVLTAILTLALKTLIGRYRPVEWFTQHLYGFHGLSLQHAVQSMPSGHAALSCAAAMAISYYSRLRSIRIIVWVLAIAVCLSRIITVQHYCSDVIFGGVLGSMTTLFVCQLLQRRHIKI